jgi:CO/xanthine dehydrogenase Mo-binding subunit
VKVSRLTSAHDLGKVINPVTAEGQIEGGAAQGLGYALIEELVEKDGVFKNPNFTDYILPSAPDAPEFKTLLLEHPYPAGPYGAKGVAESPIIGPAPAIANAVRHACGVRLGHIPAMPERIWEALNGKKN